MGSSPIPYVERARSPNRFWLTTPVNIFGSGGGVLTNMAWAILHNDEIPTKRRRRWFFHGRPAAV